MLASLSSSSAAVPCRAVPCDSIEWKRTVPLPTTQQCWPICHPAAYGGLIGMEEDSAFVNHRVPPICYPVVQQRRGALHIDGLTSASGHHPAVRQCGSARSLMWTHSNEAGRCLCLTPGSARYSVVQFCSITAPCTMVDHSNRAGQCLCPPPSNTR